MAENLMALWPKLTKWERKEIVVAARREGYLPQYFPCEEVVAKAIDKILLVRRDVVIRALRGDAPSGNQAVRDTLRRLESEPCNSKASR
jgi:hypothetical protein